MWKSRPGWIALIGWSPSGEDASGQRGWRGWMRSLGQVGRGHFPPAEIAEVKALACELPAISDRPLSRWSAAELAREAVSRGVVCSVSGTTVWRWLAQDAIRPWAWRSWVFPRDPQFREKAERVLDLYARRWEGKRLHPGDYVVSADEQTQLQALLRRHPLVAPGPGRPGLVEHEYRRGGTLAYLAAMDVHDPKRGLFGGIELAPAPWGVLVGDRGGDVLLEVAGAAFSEVDVHVVAVESRDGGDEPGAVGVDDLAALAVA